MGGEVEDQRDQLTMKVFISCWGLVKMLMRPLSRKLIKNSHLNITQIKVVMLRNLKKFQWLTKSSLTQKKSKSTINMVKKDLKKEVVALLKICFHNFSVVVVGVQEGLKREMTSPI